MLTYTVHFLLYVSLGIISCQGSPKARHLEWDLQTGNTTHAKSLLNPDTKNNLRYFAAARGCALPKAASDRITNRERSIGRNSMSGIQ